MLNRIRAKSNSPRQTKHYESMFHSHMNRKTVLKSIERVSPLMNRTCFICQTSSRYGRARPQAQMVPPSQPPPQSRPVYEDVKLAEGSHAASAREVAHTDWLFHPCLMIHYRCRTCSRTFCLAILIFWKSLGWEMHLTTVFYDLITKCLLKRKQSIAWKKSIGIKARIVINIARGTKLSGFVHVTVLMLSIRNEKKCLILILS